MSGKHILLVGADPTNGKLAQDLIDKGDEVSAVDSVVEALRSIERSRPTVAFVNLPGHPAIEDLAHGLNERGIVLPIVLLNENEEARQWAKDVGAAAFVPHPARLQGGICENLEAA